MQYVARMLTQKHLKHLKKFSSGHSRQTAHNRAVSSSSSRRRTTNILQAAATNMEQPVALEEVVAGKPLLSVAPMMDWTDVHYRQLARIISKHTWLWTEMVVDKTILHAEPLEKWLWFPPEQHPLVLQLGGSDPALLQQATQAAAAYGYDEFNLNCGCPSDRVAGAGCFGASLMLEPQLVADCMAAIAAGAAAGGSSARVSVKCRLGVDGADSYAHLAEFVQIVSERGGVTDFVIHARKCLLNGLSPAQNRSVPPLRHDWVWALKRDFPHLSFQLNGGITTSHAAAQALALGADSSFGIGPGALDGVMIGRAAYNDPWGVLGDADVSVFGAQQNGAANRRQVVEEYCKYGDSMLGRWRTRDDGSLDPNIRTIIKPLLNLFHGERGGKRWKNAVDIALRTMHPSSLSELIEATISHIPDAVLDAPPRSAAEAAAFANNGVLPPPYSLAVDRLAVPEDRARGEREPQRGKKRGKAKRRVAVEGSAANSCSGSVCGSDSEAEEYQQQQQQVVQQMENLLLQQQQQQQQQAQPEQQGSAGVEQQLQDLWLQQQAHQQAAPLPQGGAAVVGAAAAVADASSLGGEQKEAAQVAAAVVA